MGESVENDFQPWPNGQTQEVSFSRKIKNRSHLPLNFNNNSVKKVQFQKHLGVYLDDKLNLPEHLQNIFNMVKKTLCLLCYLNYKITSLVTIYKSFKRPHLDYRNTLYDQTFNIFFFMKGSHQFNMMRHLP